MVHFVRWDFVERFVEAEVGERGFVLLALGE
jgi:hypothetical protein